MSRPLIILVGLVYAYISAEQAVRGNAPMAVMYGGYALSNIGLWLMAS